jgi:hypothetical protein
MNAIANPELMQALIRATIEEPAEDPEIIHVKEEEETKNFAPEGIELQPEVQEYLN